MSNFSYKDLIATLVIMCIAIVVVSLFSFIPNLSDVNQGILARIILILVTLGLLKYYNLIALLKPKRTSIYYACLCIILISLSVYFVRNKAYELQINVSVLQYVKYFVQNLLVGVFEELLFRVLIFYLLFSILSNSKLRLFKSLIFSSLIFGMFHSINALNGDAMVYGVVTQIFYAMGLGVFFQAMYVKTTSLLLCVCAHTLVNFLTGFELGLFGIISERHFEEYTESDLIESLIFALAFVLISLMVSSIWILDNLRSNKLHSI